MTDARSARSDGQGQGAGSRQPCNLAGRRELGPLHMQDSLAEATGPWRGGGVVLWTVDCGAVVGLSLHAGVLWPFLNGCRPRPTTEHPTFACRRRHGDSLKVPITTYFPVRCESAVEGAGAGAEGGRWLAGLAALGGRGGRRGEEREGFEAHEIRNGEARRGVVCKVLSPSSHRTRRPAGNRPCGSPRNL